MFPLRISGLCFAPEGRAILDGLDLELSGEGISVILGPNGAGKTLLAAPARRLAAARCRERRLGWRPASRMAVWPWFFSSRCCSACRSLPMSNSPCVRRDELLLSAANGPMKCWSV
jgi:hypothetical protein